MSKLSIRVEKANGLTFVDTPGTKTSTGSAWGSKGDYYTVTLCQKKQWEKVTVADQELNAVVIVAKCETIDHKRSEGLSPMCNCKGNERHTVCYHSLGYLKHKLAQRDKHISYYESIIDALNGLNFGGQLTKVVSKQGSGYVWAIVRDKPQVLSTQENIALMRGSESDEGID